MVTEVLINSIIESDPNNNFGLAKFNTFNGNKLFLIYDLKQTTFGELFKAFADNYSCKEIESHNILFRISDKVVGDDEYNSLVASQCNKICDIRLIEKQQQQKTYSYTNTAEKNYIDIEQIEHIKNEPIQLFVNTLTGKKMYFYTTTRAQVLHIKCMIQDKEGIPLDQQRLIYRGIQLSDEVLLAQYGIQNSDNLTLVLRLRGGMYHETSGKNGGFGQLKSAVLFISSKISDEFCSMLQKN